MLQSNIRYIRRQGDVRSIDRDIPKKIRINLMLLIRNAEPCPRVDRLHSENPHQMSGLMASHVISPPLQRPAHPPAPVIRKIQINLVHLLENVLILLAQSGPLVVKRGPVKIKYLALTPDAQFLMILLHKLSFHRFWSCLYFYLETPDRVRKSSSLL